jgi:hypothetical protein
MRRLMVFHGFCALKGQCHGILNLRFFHQSAFSGLLIFATQVAAGGKDKKRNRLHLVDIYFEIFIFTEFLKIGENKLILFFIVDH